MGPETLLQDRQVEVDDVPASQHIRVEFTDASGQADEQVALGGVAVDGRRVVGGLTDEVDLFQLDVVGAAPQNEGTGQHAGSVGRCLDIEGQHRQTGLIIIRRQLRLDIDTVDAVARPPRAREAHAAANATIDEILPGESEVGLVGAHLVLLQTLGEAAQLMHLAQTDAHDRLAVHRRQARGLVQLGAGTQAEGSRPGQFGVAQVEGGALAAVGEGEGLARLETTHAEEGGPISLAAVEDVEEEAALAGHLPNMMHIRSVYNLSDPGYRRHQPILFLLDQPERGDEVSKTWRQYLCVLAVVFPGAAVEGCSRNHPHPVKGSVPSNGPKPRPLWTLPAGEPRNRNYTWVYEFTVQARLMKGLCVHGKRTGPLDRP